MSINCSASFNTSLPTHLNVTIHVFCRLLYCLKSSTGAYIINTIIFTNSFLIFPLCIFILNLGLKQWRQQGSSRRMSHSDFFTYHLVMMELINVVGFMFSFCGVHANLTLMAMLGVIILPINFTGQLMFHTLTCIDRYLAVSHPITYMSLKNTNGFRARNVITACVWLLSFTVIVFMAVISTIFLILVSYCFVPTAMIIMSFCSISILWTLINPKPGKGVRDRRRVDPMKLRALCTIMVILGVLLFRFGGNTVAFALDSSVKPGETECVVMLCDFFFSLPCSLVLPLLFLHKTAKIKCC